MFGMMVQPVDAKTHIELEHARAQRNFAMLVFMFSFLLLLVVSLAAIKYGTEAQMVFTTITTLIGTWVGTLLAFFYSRENFEAASRSMQQTISKLSPEERLQSISAEAAMVPYNQMVVVESANPEALTLANLKAEFDKNPVATRMPILNSDKSVFAIVHESSLDNYLAANPTKVNPTLKDLLGDPDGARAKVLLFLSRLQTLRDAHAAIQLVRDAKDVFVTETGAGKEPVLGWITDTTVIDKMKP